MLVQVELVLPKQVCRELLYGFAEKPIQPHYQVLEVTVGEITIMIVGHGNYKKSLPRLPSLFFWHVPN